MNARKNLIVDPQVHTNLLGEIGNYLYLFLLIMTVSSLFAGMIHLVVFGSDIKFTSPKFILIWASIMGAILFFMLRRKRR